MTLTGKWTVEERIAVVLAILPQIQLQIYAGKYGSGPNITTIQHVLLDKPEELEPYRDKCQTLIDANEGT